MDDEHDDTMDYENGGEEGGESESGDEGNERILAYILASTSDPQLVHDYREGGEHYLRKQWGFTDADIEYVNEDRDLAPGGPATLAMTVWPQPPIVWPRPPTVWG